MKFIVWIFPTNPRLPSQFSKSIEEIIVGYSKTSKGFNPLRDLRSSAEQPVEYRVLDLFDDAAEIDRVRLSSKLRLKVDVGGAVRMVSLADNGV